MDERLGREARELIERALREEEQADPAELARIRKRVLAVSVGVGALGSAGKTFAAPGTGGAVGAVSIMKAALLGASAAVVAVSLSSVLGLHERARAPAPESAQTAALEPVAQATAVARRTALEPSADSAAQSVSATPSARHIQGPSLPPAASSPPEPKRESTDAATARREDAPSALGNDSSLLQEIALLERVQAALRAGNGARALSLLDQSSPASGSGQLGAERLAAEVFAACQVGDRPRAVHAARRFLTAYPATPASARVRASCAGEEAGR